MKDRSNGNVPSCASNGGKIVVDGRHGRPARRSPPGEGSRTAPEVQHRRTCDVDGLTIERVQETLRPGIERGTGVAAG